MMRTPQQFTGFTPPALESLLVPGVNERWAAVQELLHPQLAALAEQLRAAALRRFPRAWPLYDISYKSQRYVNRGPALRAPIDEYYLAIDRPPRGAGVYLAISGAERLIIVALQLHGVRKDDLRRVWEAGRAIWLPLVEQLTDVRFARTAARRPPAAVEAPGAGAAPHPVWLDHYLATRAASALLAGFAYRWSDPRVAQPAFAKRLIDDALALLALNEAVMEQAELLDPDAAATLREHRAGYAAFAQPPIETIIERIRARGFALSDTIIRAYHVALHTKPLVILPGISGTGKTRLTRLYADALYADTIAPAQANPYYLRVAVQPDWHNPRDLLGYYNAITGRFHPTPFLRFLHQATSDPAALYFVCLDEMNLARPEYYLAPILSAIETEDHLIDLGAPGALVEAVSGEQLANPFRIPLNVRIIGTVNVDESAYALSDKLIDRANLIELTDVDLAAFRQTYHGPVDPAAWEVIERIHAIVARAGQPFGYRAISEMLRYIEQARGVLRPDQALDLQIKQKIVPKLRGEDTPRLRRALVELLELLLGQPHQQWGKAAAIEPAAIAAAPFPASAEKVRQMLERLDAEGFTDFYG